MSNIFATPTFRIHINAINYANQKPLESTYKVSLQDLFK